MQAGTSAAAGALNYRRRSSTTTAGGASAAVGGTRRGSAHREKLFGRDAETYGMHRWLRDDYKGTGEWCTLAHVDGKMRCYASNEIKLLEKEFGTDRTARDGHARAARCATPQPEQ